MEINPPSGVLFLFMDEEFNITITLTRRAVCKLLDIGLDIRRQRPEPTWPPHGQCAIFYVRAENTAKASALVQFF